MIELTEPRLDYNPQDQYHRVELTEPITALVGEITADTESTITLDLDVTEQTTFSGKITINKSNISKITRVKPKGKVYCCLRVTIVTSNIEGLPTLDQTYEHRKFSIQKFEYYTVLVDEKLTSDQQVSQINAYLNKNVTLWTKYDIIQESEYIDNEGALHQLSLENEYGADATWMFEMLTLLDIEQRFFYAVASDLLQKSTVKSKLRRAIGDQICNENNY